MSDTATFTYQTRLELTPLQPDMLDAYAALYGKVERQSQCHGDSRRKNELSGE